MKPKKYYLIGVFLCLFANFSVAQIYSQGKNINKGNVYFVQVELVQKPADPGKYHASIEFSGRRKDVAWYLKEGVEHKAFSDKEDLISYLSDNGWIYLKSEIQGNSKNPLTNTKFHFRKSMEQLAQENSEHARNDALFGQ